MKTMAVLEEDEVREFEELKARAARLLKENSELKRKLSETQKAMYASDSYSFAVSPTETVLVNPYLERRLKELLPECKSIDDFCDWIIDAKDMFRDGSCLLKRGAP